MSDKNFWNGEPTNGSPEAATTKIQPSDASEKERNFDTKWLALGIAGIAVIVGGAVVINNNLGNSPDTDDTSDLTGTIAVDNGDLKINWSQYQTYDYNLDELGSITITTAGIYHLTGTLEDGTVIVNATQDSPVKLILDNVTIKNPSGPAIACYAADDLVIELVGENNLSDGTKYTDYDEDVQGVIYSKDDLTFEGTGTLNLTANYLDGIVAKDDLKFNSGTYNITANDDAIRGKDSVYIVDGTFNLTANSDGIKSTNETDTDKGFVLIENGTFTIKTSAKGIKAVNSIIIYGGTYTIDSVDDAVHSNNYIGIAGGDFTINSGDDGMHADRELIVDSGTIDIKKSYEGLEAQAITINGGDISVVASDDGLNAGGGADSSANNRPGAGAFDADESCILTINGGNIYINASGDGVDSNGYLYFNGGNVVIDGPTNNGNGALDSGISITQNGGTVFAVGTSGMAETLGSTSSIYNASIYLSSSQAAGTKIEIKDASGNTVINHTSAKTFNHIAVGTPEFKSGETYTIYINGSEYQSFTISSTTTTVGNTNGNFNNMMPQGRGRR